MGETLPIALPAGAPAWFVEDLRSELERKTKELDPLLSPPMTSRERACLAALVGLKLYRRLMSLADPPPEYVNPRHPAWRGIRSSLVEAYKENCDDHGGGQGGPRVVAALEWTESSKKAQDRRTMQERQSFWRWYFEQIAKGPRCPPTGPGGLCWPAGAPPPPKEVLVGAAAAGVLAATPPAGAALAAGEGAAFAGEAMTALASFLVEWGPVLATGH